MEERKVAFITGGSRGIGKQVALKFAKNGYNIVINYVSDNTDIKGLQEECEKENVEFILSATVREIIGDTVVDKYIRALLSQERWVYAAGKRGDVDLHTFAPRFFDGEYGSLYCK